MTFTSEFLDKCRLAIQQIDVEAVEHAVLVLNDLRQKGGRLFVAGNGGGAGHASHAVSDFRSLCAIEAYAPCDNISELTASINDHGWESSLTNILKASKIAGNDALLLFSVGGGDDERGISTNLIHAAKYARRCSTKVITIVGRDGGYLGRHSDVTILLPAVDEKLVTPITEGLQAVVWHLLVSHPLLQKNASKWESQAEVPQEV